MPLFPHYFRLSSTSNRSYRLFLDQEIVGGIDYSLSEQDTGLKWVDGKTLYRKTLAVAAGPNNGTSATAHGITGLDNVISAIGYLRSGSTRMMVPNGNDGTAGGIRVLIGDGNLNLVSTSNFSAFAGHVTLLYTKT